jgi:hypothetical protein
VTIRLPLTAVCLLCAVSIASGQPQSPDPETRAGLIAADQQEKAKDLQPYRPNKAERWVKELEETFLSGQFRWHPFFESAYRGGGFTLGAGYLAPIGDYETVDLRGSWTPAGYLRFESEFRAPRLFDRRGTLSLIGGWRKATEVGYYGLGTDATSKDDEALYSFTQPYALATLDVRPWRHWLVLTGGVGYAEWQTGRGEGSSPSIDDVYTPESAPGLGATTTYLNAFGGVAADSRLSAGYARRGGYYAVTFHTFVDNDDLYGFRRIDYEAIQHVPLGRDRWVLSLRGKVETTDTAGGQVLPYFMMPSLGGGSDLRGFNSWRFRDRHSLLLQAEWRVLVNAFLDTSLFYDAGKVTSRTADLDLTGLKSDFGIGFRLHGPLATPLRIDFAKSNEGLHLVFSANAVF